MLEALALASHGGQLIHERRRSLVFSEVAPVLVTPSYSHACGDRCLAACLGGQLEAEVGERLLTGLPDDVVVGAPWARSEKWLEVCRVFAT
jgi:hypothetical protein